MKWIARIPLPLLVVMTLWMLAAPFAPEPHLVQKWHMLQAGTLTKPLDIFDVFWHLLPAALLVLRLRVWQQRRQSGSVTNQSTD